MYYPRLTLEQINLFIEEYKNGMTIDDVAAKYKVSAKNLSSVFKRNNVQLRNSKDYLTPLDSEKIKKIIDMAKLGIDKTKICKDLHICLKTLQKILKDNNIDLNAIKIENKKVLYNKIFDLYNNGNAMYKISKILNISIPRISKFLKLNGIKPKNGREYMCLNNEMRKQVVIDYANGAILSEIIQKFKLKSRTTIRSYYYFLIKRNLLEKNIILQYKQRVRSERIPSKRGGTKDICAQSYETWKGSAEVRNYEWDISKEEIQSIFEQQNGKCYYTGIKLITHPNTIQFRKFKGNPFLISLDRKDSNLSYTKDNVVLCGMMINFMKSDWSEAEFSTVLKEISLSVTNKYNLLNKNDSPTA